jgi:predicted nucleotidyltransferase
LSAAIRMFKLLFEEKMLSQPGVEKISYLGSTEREFDWVPGESDLDILVYGSAIPGDVKRYGILLIRDLNFELNLRLEDVPLEHPTPAYIDSPARTMLTLFAPALRGFTEPIRQLFKKYPPPLTHREFWELVENLPPPLTQLL